MLNDAMNKLRLTSAFIIFRCVLWETVAAMATVAVAAAATAVAAAAQPSRGASAAIPRAWSSRASALRRAPAASRTSATRAS